MFNDNSISYYTCSSSSLVCPQESGQKFARVLSQSMLSEISEAYIHDVQKCIQTSKAIIVIIIVPCLFFASGQRQKKDFL
jgi:hypothetical protein